MKMKRLTDANILTSIIVLIEMENPASGRNKSSAGFARLLKNTPQRKMVGTTLEERLNANGLSFPQ